MTHPKCMADIYRRLASLGFDARFVRTALLPDWWEDAAAAVPFNRALAEATIARHLGLAPSSLRDQKASLVLPAMPAVRLKSATRGTSVSQIRPAIHIAQRAAALLARASDHVSRFERLNSAQEIRSSLLSRSVPITLDTLVEYCWSRGIAVAHLSHLPNPPGFRKFDGIVLFVDDRPCILLSESRDSPPMLAFHLAHELGHLMLRHVGPGSVILADDNLERIVTDEVEDEADRFASEVLTGFAAPEMQSVYGLTGERLAHRAREFGAMRSIDPGILTLIYGRSADRWGAATNALKRMGLDHGARRIIRGALSAHVDLDQLSDADRSFLEALALPSPRSEPIDGVVP